MKNLTILFVVYLLFAGPSFSGEFDNEDYSTGISKINDYLYTAEKEPGLYFVLQRVDKAVPNTNINFWRSYLSRQQNSHSVYLRRRLAGEKGWPSQLTTDQRLDSGLTGFEASLKYDTENELWIAFVSQKNITDESQINMDDIEMAFAVMTTNGAPMVTHMGISRSFTYLIGILDKNKNKKRAGLSQEEEKEYIFHSNIAIPLHSFVAKVMLMRYSEILYMITVPVGDMGEIMKKALPGHFYSGDNITRIKKIVGKEIPYTAAELAEIKKLEEQRDKAKEEGSDLYVKWKKLKRELSGLTGEKREARERDFQTVQERRAELRDLTTQISRKLSDIKDKRLQELSWAEKIDKHDSPILRNLIPQKIQILGRDRKKVVWEFDKDIKTIKVNGQILKNGEIQKYAWFYEHSYMGPEWSSWGYVTLDYNALATASPLGYSSRLFYYLKVGDEIGFKKAFTRKFLHGKIKGQEAKWLNNAAYFNRGSLLRFIIDETKAAIESLELNKKTLSDLLLEFNRPGDEYIALTLLKKGADVNAQDYAGRTALYEASGTPEIAQNGEENSLKMVRILLDHGASVNLATVGKDTPLHEAASNNNVKIAQLLLEKGAEVDAQNSYEGYTPLHYAAERGDVEMVNLLLQYGANAHIKSTLRTEKTPIEVAKNERVRQLLLNY